MGIIFNRLSNYCGTWIKHGSWYPSRKLRLWDKRKGSWGGVNPHDKFILQKGSTKKYLKGDLKHYPYLTKAEYINQIHSFSEIFANSHFNLGTHTNILMLFIKPLWRFIRDYFFRFGFLDGEKGLIICLLSSFETYLKYRKLIYLYKIKKSKFLPVNQNLSYYKIGYLQPVQNSKNQFTEANTTYVSQMTEINR
ncbi:MAG: hypothetical protein HC830_02080 [Bacteroidetes bacterium]|nr:hypothetical protein [Bacteroidota bacterium]